PSTISSLPAPGFLLFTIVSPRLLRFPAGFWIASRPQNPFLISRVQTDKVVQWIPCQLVFFATERRDSSVIENGDQPVDQRIGLKLFFAQSILDHLAVLLECLSYSATAPIKLAEIIMPVRGGIVGRKSLGEFLGIEELMHHPVHLYALDGFEIGIFG